jgi:hypothetical protein
MLAGMTTTPQHLLAWVHAHGLAALDEVFREEAVVLAGPKGLSLAKISSHSVDGVPCFGDNPRDSR